MQTDNNTLDRETLSAMLDLTYELEGLIHLALNRDNAPDRIGVLLADKISALKAVSDGSDWPDWSAGSEGSELPDLSESSYIINDDDDAPVERNSDGAEEPAPESGAAASVPVAVETETATSVPMAAETETAASVPVPPSSQRSAPGTPVFSINDRFLYSRELFGGRVADFEAALKEVASMESFEEAEDYLTSEWGLDPESQTVADFLAVISNYFE